MQLTTLQLKKNAERRIKGGHLWVYSNEIDTRKTPLKQFNPGQQVRVISHSNAFLGSAYVNPSSLIAARLFSRDETELTPELLTQRIEKALTLRQQLFADPFYRLIYGESDLLPGLIVDRFGDHLAVQLNTAGMNELGDMILEILKKVVSPNSILLRNDSSIRELEGMDRTIEIGYGIPPREVQLIENNITMLAPLHGGQKTGWFYDQRRNRAELCNHVRDKRVLDVFSYVGSFAVNAAVSGAREIWAVDGSRFAIEMAEKNAALNGVADKFTGAIGDAFDVLKALHKDQEKFDVIIVDPPAFIKRKKDHQEGLRAYRRINELAMRLLTDDGLLLSASCSMHLQHQELMNILRGCSQSTGRHCQVIFEGMQGSDHPVHPAIAETRYLKAILTRVYTV